jgi:hypothetical protein
MSGLSAHPKRVNTLQRQVGRYFFFLAFFFLAIFFTSTPIFLGVAIERFELWICKKEKILPTKKSILIPMKETELSNIFCQTFRVRSSRNPTQLFIQSFRWAQVIFKLSASD